MTTLESASFTEARGRLVEHPVYAALKSPDDVRIFMKHHVFAVWDFFSLLKRLQREVTCVDVPWRPRPHAEHGRFVMEIVLSEETDEDLSGGYISHFELYRLAMSELGADDGPIEGYLACIEAGGSALEAIDSADLPLTVKAFLRHTLGLALHGAPHEVAASFCHGRENLLPDVLGPLRDGLGDLLSDSPIFAHYLDRHITLDHDEHGPLALRLLGSLCADDPALIAEAEQVGLAAIEARVGLWDGVLNEIQGRA